MPERVTPTQSPPLGVIAPFFLFAPAGLFVAGAIATQSGHEAFVAINTYRTVAITHSLVLGWASLFLFGASYQLGSAVLGGSGLRRGMAWLQLGTHAIGVVLFVVALLRWEVWLMAAGGTAIGTSFALFAWNTVGILRKAPTRSHPRTYLLVGLAFLGAGATVGLTFVGNFEHRWFAPGPGRLAAHAHLGLVGWMGITLMGVSYQLVPMFNIVHRVKPRVPAVALAITVVGITAFALGMATEPPQAIRIALALLLILGPALWMADQLNLLFRRSRRKLDFHGKATFVSLAFLGLTMVLGLVAATGAPLQRAETPAAVPLAYGAAGILGWIGTAILANSYKIMPFLVWYHRFRTRMGREPVPLVRDLAPEWWAVLNLSLHGAATVTVVGGALFASETTLHAGGGLLMVSALVHAGGMALMFLPRRSSRAGQIQATGLSR